MNKKICINLSTTTFSAELIAQIKNRIRHPAYLYALSKHAILLEALFWTLMIHLIMRKLLRLFVLLFNRNQQLIWSIKFSAFFYLRKALEITLDIIILTNYNKSSMFVRIFPKRKILYK